MKIKMSEWMKSVLLLVSVVSFSASQVQAVETSYPADPTWGLDPLGGTLLKPGISVHTMGTFDSITGKHAADGDHSLKLFDTRTPTRADNRPPENENYSHANWDVGSIGNVYGLAIDKHRNIFATASTHYGTSFGFEAQNDSKIGFGEIGAGAAADTAGTDNNAEDLNNLDAAGTIYKIDAVTGVASVFAKLPQTAHAFNQNACENNRSIPRNTGPALGNIAYDKVHDQFFVSNFEDGRIYRLDADGAILNNFQPAGFAGLVPNGGTTSGKSPYGLAVNLDGTKLYFGTIAFGDDNARTKPELFAIDLDGGGNFSGAEINQGATLRDDLAYTQNIGGQFVGNDGSEAPVWVSYSDLNFTPVGELVIGLRTGCRGSLATSHNHGGLFTY